MLQHGIEYLSALTAAFLFSCSTDNGLTGTTSGVESKVAKGFVTLEDGHPAVSADIRLIPADYNPVNDAPLPESASGFTDDSGGYTLYAADTGTYNIIASLNETNSLLIRNVTISESSTTVPTHAMHQPGYINVTLPDRADTVNGFLYLPGTTILHPLRGHTVSAVLSPVPAADYKGICYTVKNSSAVTMLKNNISVHSNDTTTVAMYAWNYSQKLVLNTTPSGANVTETVTRFPLLVRLNNHATLFSQSLSNGEDIRFTKANGSPLPCQVEYWDSAAAKAVVWVAADTIYGNDSSQYITMYWGASTGSVSPPISNRAAVFDTAAGFAAVYHLSDNASSATDATTNGFDGTVRGNAIRSDGVIGFGRSLDGAGDYIDAGNRVNPLRSDFTFSAWVKKNLSGKRQTIASKSTGGSASASYGWLLELDPSGAPVFFMATDTGTWGSSGTFTIASAKWITDSLWHHVAVCIDRSGDDRSRLYLDGEDVSILPTARVAPIGTVTNTMPLRFGADANGGNPLTGCIDECELTFRARPAGWARLSYMNQKTDDRLVVFR
jgi:hypothetical protein